MLLRFLQTDPILRLDPQQPPNKTPQLLTEMFRKLKVNLPDPPEHVPPINGVAGERRIPSGELVG